MKFKTRSWNSRINERKVAVVMYGEIFFLSRRRKKPFIFAPGNVAISAETKKQTIIVCATKKKNSLAKTMGDAITVFFFGAQNPKML